VNSDENQLHTGSPKGQDLETDVPMRRTDGPVGTLKHTKQPESGRNCLNQTRHAGATSRLAAGNCAGSFPVGPFQLSTFCFQLFAQPSFPSRPSVEALRCATSRSEHKKLVFMMHECCTLPSYGEKKFDRGGGARS